ncbi:helicase HerA-like domain-containing protein [Saccharopolyspora sp. ASAGF58]|uniref:helicase HerA-like domain-containing protein n=1 Tax=Saccharopolyspora sp. ASAGF58 TaxID=2719023 RepID=UPI0014451B76
MGTAAGPVQASLVRVRAAAASSDFRGKYEQAVDRESAYELLAKKVAAPEPPEATAAGDRAHLTSVTSSG